MTEADSYDEADEGEETRVVIQYRRSTKVAGKGSCIRLGVSGVCATASAFLIRGHFDSLFISHSFFDHSFPSFSMEENYRNTLLSNPSHQCWDTMYGPISPYIIISPAGKQII